MIVQNEICAGLNYVGSSIKECRIDNCLTIPGSDAQYQLQLDYEFGEQRKDQRQGLQFGRLLLHIQCKVTVENAEHLKSEMAFTIEGEFCAKDSMPEYDFNQLLLVNGISALYSIARSKAEVISAMVYHRGKISLPMINVIELIKLKQSQSESEQKKN